MIAYHFLQANMTSPNAPRTKWVEGQSRTLKGKIVPCEETAVRLINAYPTLRAAYLASVDCGLAVPHE